MMFWMLCTFFLLAICVALVGILIKDNGIISSYLVRTREYAANYGWAEAIRRAIQIVGGKVKQKARFAPARRQNDRKIMIAFYPTGGMGDYIISSKLIEELQKYSDCIITVFCEKMQAGKAVYGAREGVFVEAYSKFERTRNSYDLALMVEHFVHVINMDNDRLRMSAPQLYSRMKFIVDNWEKLYVNIPQQCFRERVQFERCRLLGLNRWTELRMGRAFEIDNQRTVIPMDHGFEREWEELNLKRKDYITLNRGADQMREGKEQLKVWSKTNYVRLVELCKKRFPQLMIVQLGSKECERIDGVDVALLGQNLELVKWIIKNSLCHIDGEGGLVHLATQLDTKCIVLFGPTPIHMYGYEQNINIISPKCNNCMGLHEDWAYKCYRNEDEPRCMQDIKPELVVEKLQLVKGIEE